MTNVLKEVFESFSVEVFIHKPITNKENQRTHYKEAHYNKIGAEVTVVVFNV